MGTSKKGKHGLNTYDNYLAVHRSTLKKFSVHATSEPSYTVESQHNAFLLKTHFKIETLQGTWVNISITKVARITRRRGRKYCETVSYRYVAYDATNKKDRFIGYHSPHFNLTAKKAPHHNFHHKHRYLESRVEFPLSDAEIPHVSDFLEEVIKSL